MPTCLYLGSGEFFRFFAVNVSAIYLAMQSRIALDVYFCDGLFSPSDAPINSDQYAHQTRALVMQYILMIDSADADEARL